jgi:glutathione S-transferase
VRIDFATGEQKSGAYLAINQKGRVPALAEGEWVRRVIQLQRL